jgi:Zn-dependent protease
MLAPVTAVRVGRVRGIDVRIDVSAIVIVALITWELATIILPAFAEGYAGAAYWSAAVAASLLFFASLLAHELSHSLVARNRGIAVRDITLWLLGGIAAIEGEPRTPRDERDIALAGPAASVTIGVVALGVGAVAELAGMSPLVVAAFFWLGSINLLLAVFNLAPAAPLDGGRVLRAWLWQRHGDRRRAARSATHAGQTFGRILIGLGIVEVLLGSAGGLWFVLLGWFLYTAARAEEAQIDVETSLGSLSVRDVMTPDPIVAPASISVADLLDEYVLRHHCSAFPLRAPDEQIVGLATLGRCRTVPVHRRATVAALDVAWRIDEVTICAPEEALLDVLRRVTGGDGRLLVFESARLVGIVSPSDISRLLQARRDQDGVARRSAV